MSGKVYPRSVREESRWCIPGDFTLPSFSLLASRYQSAATSMVSPPQSTFGFILSRSTAIVRSAWGNGTSKASERTFADLAVEAWAIEQKQGTHEAEVQYLNWFIADCQKWENDRSLWRTEEGKIFWLKHLTPRIAVSRLNLEGHQTKQRQLCEQSRWKRRKRNEQLNGLLVREPSVASGTAGSSS